MHGLLTFIGILLTIYFICVLVWALLSWLPMVSPSLQWNPVVASMRRFLDSVIEPALRPIRKFVQPMRIGGAYMDMSSMVLIVIIILLRIVVADLQ